MKQKIYLVIIGTLLALLSLELGLQVAGFVYRKRQELANQKALSREGTYRILCIGESTTQGQYPAHLEQILNEKNIGVRFSVIDKGQPGATTDYLLATLEDNLERYRPDIIVAMMGANDGRSDIVYEATATGNVIHQIKTPAFMRLLYRHVRETIKKDTVLLTGRNAGIGKSTINSDDTSRQQEQILQEKLKGPGTDVEDYIALAEFYSNKRRFIEAEKVSMDAIRLTPQYEWGYICLGNAYDGQKRYKEAEETYKKAIQLNPHIIQGYIDLGAVFAKQENYIEAARVLEEAVTRFPRNEYGYIDLADTYVKLGRYDKASQIGNKVLAIYPHNSRIYELLGSICFSQRAYKRAKEMYERAIDINPQNEYAYLGLGAVLQAQEHYAHAENLFSNASAINPKNELAKIRLGEVFEKQGKYEQAKAEFTQAIDLNPDNEPAYLHLAGLYALEGKYAEADNLLNRAKMCKRNNEHAPVLYHYSGKKTGFEAVLNGYPEGDKKIAASFMRGMRYFQEGKDFQSEKVFKRILNRDPVNALAYGMLGQLYLRQRKYPDAEQMFQKALKASPNADMLNQLGDVYYANQRWEEAKKMYEKALHMQADNFYATLGMHMTLNKLKEYKTSAQYLSRLIAYNRVNKISAQDRLFDQHDTTRVKIRKLNDTGFSNKDTVAQPATAFNYNHLNKIARARNIRLVCMQYPLVSLAPLKAMIEKREGIVFVDNEAIFKGAVAKEGYDAYFTDRFATDFGHCTPKGNRLIAHNLADAIIREILGTMKDLE